MQNKRYKKLNEFLKKDETDFAFCTEDEAKIQSILHKVAENPNTLKENIKTLITSEINNKTNNTENNNDISNKVNELTEFLAEAITNASLNFTTNNPNKNSSRLVRYSPNTLASSSTACKQPRTEH